MILSEETIQQLSRQTPQTLAEWYCDLNRWKWPAELGDEESPEEFREVSAAKTRRLQIMNWIQARVGEKLVSRVWNHKMTDDEHEEWWLKHGGRTPVKMRSGKPKTT